MVKPLIRYNEACRAIAAAKVVDEVKGFHDKAAAMQAYARQAKNRDLEIDAAEIRMRAERRLGELLASAKGKGQVSRGQPSKKKCADKEQYPRVKLAKAGIDRKLSSRSQKLAAMPVKSFEGLISDWRHRVHREGERVTANLLRRDEIRQSRTAYESRKSTGHVGALADLIESGLRFGCVLVDPPWPYENQSTRAATNNHYSTMSVEQLCALPVRKLALPDAHLHLWVTNAFLFEAPKLFAAWGFEFRSSFVWVKPQMGIGNYWRNSHEILLTAVRGNAKRFNDKAMMSWLQADRGAHSAKPEQIVSMLERASSGPRLEMFARRNRKGWVCWGDEIADSNFQEAAE